MKNLFLLVATILLTTVSQAKSVYCVLLDNGDQHCYISQNNCRDNLPPNVTCENFAISAPHNWNSFISSTTVESTYEYVNVTAFDGVLLKLLNVSNEVSSHPNYVYTVMYDAPKDKIVVTIQYNDDSYDVLDAINNPTGTILKEFSEVSKIRASGSVSVSPNPFSSSTSFKFKFQHLPANPGLVLQIYNLNGTLVFTREGLSNNAIVQVTSSDLTQIGSYVYKVYYSTNKISQGTLIRN